MQLSLALGERPIIELIRARLLACFGPQQDAERHDPVSQLVRAIISSRTRDEVSSPAFERLRLRYTSWELLRDANHEEIETFIQPVTNADLKAKCLPRAIRMIIARTGALELDFLADWEEEMAMQWLRGLPGVGTKVAATVLNFSMLRKRALSVDTHLLRVGERLGILPAGADYDRGYDAYMRIVPDSWQADDLYELHWLLKYLGQEICAPLAPACPRCPLHDLCARPLS
jgi:endonuclease-3